jgi:type I restriction enzyme S subunit
MTRLISATEENGHAVGWRRARLEDLSAFITKGSTPTTFGFKWAHSGVLFLRSECVAEHGLDLRQSMFISGKAHAALKRSEILPDDLLVTITGNVGRVARFVGTDRANLNQHIARVRITAADAESQFVYYWLSQPSVRRYFEGITTGQAYPQLSLKQVRDTEIPLPALPEQRAIAAALSDVDALLYGLARVIAKKRDLKEAAMQQLLTGHTRLPGFGAPWEMKTLDEICQKIQDGTHFSPKLGGNDYLYLTSRNIRLGSLDLSNVEWISAAEHAKIYARCDVRKGDLLLTKDGASTGNAALNTLDDPFSLLSSVAFLRFDNARHSATYFLYQILSTSGQNGIKELMSGNAITRLTLAKIKALQFPVPPLAEQTAIATVLSDMDAELAALEARRAKTQALKQAMMQSLLTGRIRLVSPEPAHA